MTSGTAIVSEAKTNTVRLVACAIVTSILASSLFCFVVMATMLDPFSPLNVRWAVATNWPLPVVAAGTSLCSLVLNDRRKSYITCALISVGVSFVGALLFGFRIASTM